MISTPWRGVLSTAIGTLALCGATAAAPAHAGSDTYPQRPIHVVVPFAPGGSVDTVARLISAKLSDKLKQQVVVSNRTGAGGNIGTQAVVSAAADGYTLLWGVASNIAINASLYKSLPYDVRRDLVPVALVAEVPNMVLINNDIPAKNVEEFVAYAKSQQLAFASAGVGSSGHLTSELFRHATSLNMLHIPYKGTAMAYPDLISGRVAMMSDGVTSPMASSGKVRPLAVAAKRRSPLVPDVPTLEELGIKGVDTAAWMGLLAPTGTPPQAIDTVNAAITDILRDPAVLQSFAQSGADPLGGTPGQFGAFIESEIARWAKVVDMLNIQAD